MKITALALSLTSLLAGSVAYADDTDSLDGGEFDHHVAAPTNALELGVATGYTQGVGPIAGGTMQHLEDVSRAGGAVEVDASYRINPMFAVGLYSSFSQYAAGNQIGSETDVYGATGGVQGTMHLRAERSVDPWLSLGTGWRGLWLSPASGKTTSLQGLELARLQIGADYRVSERVSITPVIGGSVNMFLGEDSPMTTKLTELDDKKVNFIGFAGLAGRFDL